MKILLTNDDGYKAIGIQTLFKVLNKDHDVVLAAPDRERSAVGHSITLHEPMQIKDVNLPGDKKGYAISGAPADCVKLGLYKLFDSPPDVVISGINNGTNTGININYSGTAAAAREAALNKLPGIAVSIERSVTMDYQGMASFISQLVEKMKNFNLPPATFLNVNAPGCPLDEIQGIQITRQPSNNLSNEFEEELDSENRTCYRYGQISLADHQPGTDVYAVSQKYISITPIQCNSTDDVVISDLQVLETSFLN